MSKEELIKESFLRGFLYASGEASAHLNRLLVAMPSTKEGLINVIDDMIIFLMFSSEKLEGEIDNIIESVQENITPANKQDEQIMTGEEFITLIKEYFKEGSADNE